MQCGHLISAVRVGLTCGARVREGASLGRHGTYRSHCFRCSDVGLSGGFCLASCEQDGGGKAETPILKSVGCFGAAVGGAPAAAGRQRLIGGPTAGVGWRRSALRRRPVERAAAASLAGRAGALAGRNTRRGRGLHLWWRRRAFMWARRFVAGRSGGSAVARGPARCRRRGPVLASGRGARGAGERTGSLGGGERRGRGLPDRCKYVSCRTLPTPTPSPTPPPPPPPHPCGATLWLRLRSLGRWTYQTHLPFPLPSHTLTYRHSHPPQLPLPHPSHHHH